MDDNGIFLIKNKTMVVLNQVPYEKEDLLQEALASFPAVLAGISTENGAARPLMLVRREMGVPKAEGAASTWSIDHLFLDADGVPVVVEVKRSSDTRIRREVIGQMLDYAANAVRYWPVSDIQTAFDNSSSVAGLSSEERIRQVAPGMNPEAFWQSVSDNLKAGRIRMVFVADHLPPELIRIIEFLNEQMTPAEVLGVEVPQYVGDDGHQVLVPRVIGRTSAAVAAKRASGRQWDKETFMAEAMLRHGDSHKCSSSDYSLMLRGGAASLAGEVGSLQGFAKSTRLREHSPTFGT